MNKCDTCQRKRICHINAILPTSSDSISSLFWHIMSEKKKLYLANALVEKAGGVERIERLFDCQFEVVIVPDSFVKGETND